MKNRDDSMQWIPLWVDKWIFGSTRIELCSDERAVWIDLMALASKDNGHIRANLTTPYSSQQLAGLFCITEELLQRTVQQCLKTGKIEEIFINRQEEKFFAGYRIINWAKYQLSKRHKRRFETAKLETQTMSSKTDIVSKKTAPIGKERIGEDRKRKERKRENTLSLKFAKPTIQKIITYCQKRKNNVNPQAFFDFYESKNWMIGKNKIKNWQAAVRTWEQRDQKEGCHGKQSQNDMGRDRIQEIEISPKLTDAEIKKNQERIKELILSVSQAQNFTVEKEQPHS